MRLDLNEQEAQALLQLIDLGLKATGLPAAEAAVFFAKKIGEAGKQEKAEPVKAEA